MKGDRPDINEAEGKMVPVDEADKLLAAPDNALIPLLKGMAKRLAPICANRPAAEVQAEVENEVGQIMRQVEAALLRRLRPNCADGKRPAGIMRSRRR
jgi:hypothetical protein